MPQKNKCWSTNIWHRIQNVDQFIIHIMKYKQNVGQLMYATNGTMLVDQYVAQNT